MSTKAYSQLKEIALAQNFNIIDSGVEDPYNSGLLTNDSYSAGKDIWIGEYDNGWLKVVSLAHEMSHSLYKVNSAISAFIEQSKGDMRIEHPVLMVEVSVWENALVMLADLNIIIPDEYKAEVDNYIARCLVSYSKYKG